MSPNMMNDGHNTTLEHASSWAHNFLRPLIADDGPFARKRTLILLTWDESDTYEIPNKIGSLLLGSAVPAALRGTEDDTYYTHYSIPATVQYNWQLASLGRYDVGANVFRDVITADTPGYRNPGDPANMAGVDNSLSYPGFLNSDPARRRPVPPPNLKLVGAGGLPVADAVYKHWWKAGGEDSPYDGSGRAFDGSLYLPEYGKQKANGVLPT